MISGTSPGSAMVSITTFVTGGFLSAWISALSFMRAHPAAAATQMQSASTAAKRDERRLIM
jgi:hypothetical protein